MVSFLNPEVGAAGAGAKPSATVLPEDDGAVDNGAEPVAAFKGCADAEATVCVVTG